MSRLLGAKCRAKARSAEVSPEQEGRNAFIAGLPVSDNPYGYADGRGKGHAWSRGWERARTAAQKGGE